jgi:hypothetical protein
MRKMRAMRALAGLPGFTVAVFVVGRGGVMRERSEVVRFDCSERMTDYRKNAKEVSRCTQRALACYNALCTSPPRAREVVVPLHQTRNPTSRSLSSPQNSVIGRARLTSGSFVRAFSHPLSQFNK